MVVSAIVGAFCLAGAVDHAVGLRFESTVAVVPADVDAGHRLRPVPALPLEREHAPHRHDPGAAARHRDVARPRRDARPEGRRPPPRAPHRARRPRRRLRPVHVGREGDRVVTFGCYPDERCVDLEPSYDLGGFPATRDVLASHEPFIVDIDDPDADPAEVDVPAEHRPPEPGDAPARRPRRVDRHRGAQREAGAGVHASATSSSPSCSSARRRSRSTTRGCTTSCASSPTATR